MINMAPVHWVRNKLLESKQSVDPDELRKLQPLFEMIVCFGHQQKYSSIVGGDTCFNDVWSFSLTSRTWTQLKINVPARKENQLPVERYRHSAAYINRGVIAIFGGYSNHHHYKELFLFDLVNLTFTEISPSSKELSALPDTTQEVQRKRGTISAITSGVYQGVSGAVQGVTGAVTTTVSTINPIKIGRQYEWPSARQAHIMIYDNDAQMLIIQGGGNSMKASYKKDVCVIEIAKLFDAVPDIGIPVTFLDAQTRKKEVDRLEKKLVSSAEVEKKKEDAEYQVKLVGFNLNKGVHNEKYWLQIISEETHKIDKSPGDVEYTMTFRRCYAHLKASHFDECLKDADTTMKLIAEKIKEEKKQENIVRLNIEKIVAMLHKGSAYYKLEMYQESINILSEVVLEYADMKGKSDKLSSDILILALKQRAQAYLFYNKLDLTINDCKTMINTITSYSPPDKKRSLTGSEDSDFNIGIEHILRKEKGRMNALVDAYKIKLNAMARKKKFSSALEQISDAIAQVEKIGTLSASSNVITAIIDQNQKKKLEKRVTECKMRLSDLNTYISEQKRLYEKAEQQYQLGKQKLEEYRELVKEAKYEEDDPEEGILREAMIKHLTKSVETEAYTDTERIATLAEALYECHKYAEALDYSQKAITQDPANWRSYWIAGNCHIARRKIEKGIQTYKIGIDRLNIEQKQDTDGVSQLEKSLQDAENKQAAMEQAVKAANTAQELILQHNNKEALELLGKAVSLDPDNNRYLCDRSSLLCHMKQYHEALTDALLATKISPKQIIGYLAQAECFKLMRKYSKGIAIMEKALKIEPSNTQVLQELEELRELEDNLRSAEMEFDKGLFVLEELERDLIKEKEGKSPTLESPTLDTMSKIYQISVGKTEAEAFVRQRVDIALESIHKAIELYPYNPKWQLCIVKAYYLIHKYPLCIDSGKVTGDCIQENQLINKEIDAKVSYECCILVGQAYACQEQFDLGIKYLKETLKSVSSSWDSEQQTSAKNILSHIEDLKKEQYNLEKNRQKCQEYYFKKQYKDALKESEKYIEKWEKLFATSRSELNLRNYSSAYYDRALCYFALEKYDLAEKDCVKAIEFEKDFPHFYVLLCESLLKQNKIADAFNVVNNAIDNVAPFNTGLNNVWMRLRLMTASEEAERAFLKGQSVDADLTEQIRHLTTSLLLRPSHIQTRLSRAQKYASAAQYKQSAADCKFILSQLSVEAATEEGKKKENIKTREGIELETSILKARMEAKQLKYTAARKTLTAALKRFPNNAKMRDHLEECTRLELQTKFAEEKFTLAQRIQEEGSKAIAMNTYVQQLLTEAIALQPYNANYYKYRARVFMNQNQMELASQDIKTSIDFNNHDAESYLLHARILVAQSEYDAAEEEIKKGLDVDSDFEELKDLREELEDTLPQREEAATKFKSAEKTISKHNLLKMRGKNNSSYYLKGHVKHTDVEEEFEDDIEIDTSKLEPVKQIADEEDPDDEEEEQGYVDSPEAKEALQKAKQLLGECVKLEPFNRQYLHRYIEILQVNLEDNLEEATYQCNVMTSLHPTYPDGFELAARMQHNDGTNMYESLTMVAMSLELTEKKNSALLVALDSIVLREISEFKSTKEPDYGPTPIHTIRRKGEENIDEVIKEAIHEYIPNEKPQGLREMSVMSVDDFLEKTVTPVKIQATHVISPVPEEHQSPVFAHVRHFSGTAIPGFMDLMKHIYNEQRKEALAKCLLLLRVKYSAEQEKLSVNYNRASKLLGVVMGCTDDELRDAKRDLARRGTGKELAVEVCTTHYKMIHQDAKEQNIKAMKPYYDRNQFDTEQDYERWQKQQHDSLYKMLLTRYQINEFEINKGSDANSLNEERKNRLMLTVIAACVATGASKKIISDDSYLLLETLSDMLGLDRFLPIYLVLDNLSRQTGNLNTYTLLRNKYKALLRIVRLMFERRVEGEDFETVYATASERESFESVAAVLDREMVKSLKEHWLASYTADGAPHINTTTTQVKILSLISGLRSIMAKSVSNLQAQQDRITKLLTTTTLQHRLTAIIAKSCARLLFHLKSKTREALQSDDRSIISLCFTKATIEYLKMYENNFDECFPRNIDAFKVMITSTYQNFQVEYGLLAATYTWYVVEPMKQQLPGESFDLVTTINDLYTYLSENSSGGFVPYPIMYICSPLVSIWIEQHTQKMKEVAVRAIKVDNWHKITEEQPYTSCVIDLFTSLYQGIEAYKVRSRVLAIEDYELAVDIIKMEVIRTIKDAMNQNDPNSSNFVEAEAKRQIEKEQKQLEALDEEQTEKSPLTDLELAHQRFMNGISHIVVTFCMELLDHYNDSGREALQSPPTPALPTDPKLQHSEKRIVPILSKMALCMNDVYESVSRWKIYIKFFVGGKVEESDSEEEEEEKEEDDEEHSDEHSRDTHTDKTEEHDDDDEPRNIFTDNKDVDPKKIPTYLHDCIIGTLKTMSQSVLRQGMIENLTSNTLSTIYGVLPSILAVPDDHTKQEEILNHRFQFLDEKLSALVTELHPSLFTMVLQTLSWNFVQRLKNILMPGADQPVLSEAKLTLINDFVIPRFFDYFHAGGKGLPKEELDKEFKFLSDLIIWLKTPTHLLVDEYSKLSSRITEYEERFMRLTDKDNETDDEETEKKPISEKDEQKYKERVIMRNYYFAIIYKRSKHSKPKQSTGLLAIKKKETVPVQVDQLADQFIEAEMMIKEAYKIKLDAEEKVITTHISEYQHKHDELKQQVEEIEEQSKVLMDNYKKLKQLKNITYKRKDMRNFNKLMKKEMSEMEKSSHVELYNGIDRILTKECQELATSLERIAEKRKDIKDIHRVIQTKLYPLIQARMKKKAASIRKKKHKHVYSAVTHAVSNTVTAVTSTVSSGAKKVATTAMDVGEYGKKVIGLGVGLFDKKKHQRWGSKSDYTTATPGSDSANTDEVFNDVDELISETDTVLIRRIFPALYRFVDGFIVLIEEPKPCICWLSRSYLTNDNDSHFFFISVESLRSLSQSKIAIKLDNGISFTMERKEKDNKEYQALFIDTVERNEAFDGIKDFLLDVNDNFQEEEGEIVNQLLVKDFISDNEESDDEEEQGGAGGYVISNLLKKKFATVLAANDRLLLHIGCHESTSFLPGNLYLFTHSLCFDTLINSDGTFRVLLPLATELNKIAKVKGASAMQNSIKITDEEGRTYIFTGFDDYEKVFSDLCTTIESLSDKNGGYKLIIKQEDGIAILSRAILSINEDRQSIVGSIVSAPNAIVKTSTKFIGRTALLGVGVGVGAYDLGRKGIATTVNAGISGLATGWNAGVNLVTKKKKKKVTPSDTSPTSEED
jgi:tetratricopeptide (TPR) repeat protein